MPYFLGEYVYDKEPEKREAARPEHRDYLRGLLDRGLVVMAGPMADDANGYVLYRTDSLEQASALLQNDPYITLGGASCTGPREWNVVLRADFVPEG